MNPTRKQATEVPTHAVTWTRTCALCRAELDSRKWADLPLVQVLDHRELQPHLSVDVGWDVEVRRCACGALIASLGRRLAV